VRPHVLQTLFEPRSVALVAEGFPANSRAAAVLERLRGGGFDGELLIVGAGLECPADLQRVSDCADLARAVDLLLLLLPLKKVPAQLRAAAEQGCRAAVLLAAEGGERERRAPGVAAEILDICRSYDISLLGPDSLGVIRPGAGLQATVARSTVAAGRVALLTQSVGFSAALLDWAQSNAFGFSLVASPGGGLGVDFGAMLDYLSVDAQTRSIMLYVEHVSDARAFLSGLRAAARVKPVVVLKSGRTAGSGGELSADRVFDAAIARAGAVRVNTVHQLFTAARALMAGTRVAGPRLAIVGNASGPATMAVDRAARRGVLLESPPENCWQEIHAASVAARACGPAVDLLGSATASDYAAATQALLACADYDGVLVLLTPQASTDVDACAAAVAEVAAKARKPVLACWMGQDLVAGARRQLAQAGVLQFTSPERCLDAFSYLAAYERHQAVLLQAPPSAPVQSPSDVAGAQLMIEEALSHRRLRLTASEAKALLAAFRIPVLQSLNVHSASDALLAAETLGLPVTLHVNTPDDFPVGTVPPSRSVRDAPSVRTAYRELEQQMAQDFPRAQLTGIGVQPLRDVEAGRELLLAIERDADFGPVIRLAALHESGAGAVTLPPLNLFLCRDLIHRAFPAGPGLASDSAEERALLGVLMRLSEICCVLPEIQRLLISPLRIGGGAVCAERVEIGVAPAETSTRRYGHMAIHPYPAEMLRHWQLPDGRNVVIRPLRPEDAERERAFVENLSAESRYNRFMYRMDRLTPKMLARFTQIDYDREMALAVVLEERGDETRLLAVARYVTNPDGESCEFALTVADDVQRQGIGRQLMQSLMNAARDRGLEVMEGDVLAANRRMLRLCESLGFRLLRHPEDAEVMAVRRHL
jgi:acetyltransferase